MLPLSERTKKLLLIVLGLAIILGIAAAIYATFFRSSKAPLSPTPSQQAQNGAFPTAGKAKPGTTTGATGTGTLPTGATTNDGARTTTPSAQTDQPVSRTQTYVDAQTSFVTLDRQTGSNGVRFYNAADGKFYRVDELGTLTPLSDKAFYNVKTVSWGQRTDKAILEFPDGSNVYYNFKEDRQITLPKHWEDFNFAPNDEQIIAKSMGNNESNRFLVVSNPDGSDPQAIQELGNNGDKVETAWVPNNQIVAYAHTGDEIGFDREQIVLVGKNHENLPGLITEGRGFIPNWSNKGDSLLYSVYTSTNGYLPELWVSGGTTDKINSGRKRLELNTWADKCAWSSETILYCAVPSSLETGAALQRDAVQKGPDQIYRINLKNGEKTNLGTVDGTTEVKSLSISTDGKTAYTVDAASGNVLRFDVSR